MAFSDESTFECRSAHPVRIWRSTNQPHPTTPTFRHPPKVMMWAIISYQGTGRLYTCQGNMNQFQYLNIMQDHVLPQFREWRQHGVTTFMHDKAPCHTARRVSQFIRENRLTVLDWPGNSPDLNPIENLFGILKDRLSRETILTRDEMVERVRHHWTREITMANVKKLIDSMPRRIQSVITARGGITKY